MSYAIRQTSEWDGSEGQDWWRWAVWIEADDAELDDLAWVEYRLHPTFPSPIQRTTDRASRFRLDASGWGEFMIGVRLHRKSDGSDVELSHWLELEKPGGASAGARGLSKGEPAAVRGMAKGEAPPPAPLPVTRVVLSVGPGQQDVAERVARRLRADGVEVATQDDIQPGMPLEIQMEKMIGGADALVAVLGRRGSKWVERDMGVARSHSVPILPVLVGDPTEIPASIRDLQIMRIEEDDDEAGVRELSGNMRVLLEKFAPRPGGIENAILSRTSLPEREEA